MILKFTPRFFIGLMGLGVATTIGVLPPLLMGGTTEKNYLVQIIKVEDNAHGISQKKCIGTYNEDEDCELFDITDEEKNNLLKGTQTTISSTTAIAETTHFVVNKFFKLKFKSSVTRDNEVYLHTQDKKKIKLIVLCDLDSTDDIQELKNKTRYLYGKITSENSASNVKDYPAFTCDERTCDVKVLDLEKISLISQISETKFTAITNGTKLKQNDYVFIDLERYADIKSGISVETKDNKFDVLVDKKFGDSWQSEIQNKISKTRKIESKKDVKDYFVIKFDGLYVPAWFASLKTIEEQKTINGSCNQKDECEYWWELSSAAVKNYISEIYQITDQTAANNKDVSKLDQENNLITNSVYLKEHQDHWFKLVLDDKNVSLKDKIFTLKNKGTNVFTHTKNLEKCWKRTSSSNSLQSC